jgi:transposase-like protein
MKAPGGKFGRKKEEAIAALLTQRNIEEAAKAAGIGANTLLRWLKAPEFQLPTGKPAGRRSANPSHGSSKEPLRRPRLC